LTEETSEIFVFHKAPIKPSATRNTFCGTRYLSHCHAIYSLRGVGANRAQLSFTGAELQSILSQKSLPWQQGSAGKKFKWHHRIARARK